MVELSGVTRRLPVFCTVPIPWSMDATAVNGTSAADNVTIDQLTIDGARITGAGPVQITVATTEHLTYSGQGGNGLVLEEVLRCHVQPGLPRPGYHLDAQNRVAAERKEILLAPDVRNTQYRLPNGGQRSLDGGLRRDIRARLQVNVAWIRQSEAIQLAICSQGDARQKHKGRW